MMIGGSGDGAAFAAAELISLWVWIHTQSRALRRVHVVKPLIFLLLLQDGALKRKIRTVWKEKPLEPP